MESPPPASARLVALDALRGVALFGVLVVNAVTDFRVSSFERFLPAVIETSAADRLAERAVALGLDTKPLLLFSFLFGVGLAAQKMASARAAFGIRVVRRLLFLLVIGVAHFALLWSGDVLALYAVVAFAAALLLELPTRLVVVIAIALFGLHALPLPYPRPFPNLEAMSRHVDEARRVYGYGSYGDVVAFRWQEARPALALSLWSVPRTLALFLLGGCAWCEGVFSKKVASGHLAWIALTAGVVGASATWAVDAKLVGGLSLAAVIDVGEILTAFAIAAAVFASLDLPVVGRVLRSLAPIGRMTLTSYLIESLVLGFLFYGYGLGLFGRVGAATTVLIAVTLFVVQAVFATTWLRRFRFGPVEWLWRAFTRGAAPRPR